MPLKEEHIEDIEKLRGQIEEIVVSMLIAPERNKSRKIMSPSRPTRSQNRQRNGSLKYRNKRRI